MTWRFVREPTIRCLARPGSSLLAHLPPGKVLSSIGVRATAGLCGFGSCWGARFATGPVSAAAVEIRQSACDGCQSLSGPAGSLTALS